MQQQSKRAEFTGCENMACVDADADTILLVYPVDDTTNLFKTSTNRASLSGHCLNNCKRYIVMIATIPSLKDNKAIGSRLLSRTFAFQEDNKATAPQRMAAWTLFYHSQSTDARVNVLTNNNASRSLKNVVDRSCNRINTLLDRVLTRRRTFNVKTLRSNRYYW